MAGLDELNRAVGCLEGKTDRLIQNQDRLIDTVNQLTKALKRKSLYDSAKVIGGAFAGGFTAIFIKLGIWGS